MSTSLNARKSYNVNFWFLLIQTSHIHNSMNLFKTIKGGAMISVQGDKFPPVATPWLHLWRPCNNVKNEFTRHGLDNDKLVNQRKEWKKTIIFKLHMLLYYENYSIPFLNRTLLCHKQTIVMNLGLYDCVCRLLKIGDGAKLRLLLNWKATIWSFILNFKYFMHFFCTSLS